MTELHTPRHASPPSPPVPPALACPKCHGARLVPSTLPGPDDTPVQVDTCPACEGLWFDARELAATLPQPAADVAVPAYAMPARQATCPRCRVHLFEFCLPGTQVLVDGCRRCQGLWLDRAEWPQVRQALVEAARAPRIACPKCRVEQGSSTQCERCGAVFAKVREQQRLEAAFQAEQHARAAAIDVQAVFADAAAVHVRQNVEWIEILSPFERANRYEVTLMGPRNRGLVVQERSRSVFNWIFRHILGSLRPAHLELQDEDGRTVLSMDKPLRLFFDQLSVDDAQGRRLGTVHRRFHLLRENYDLDDAQGRTVLEIRGPLFFLPFVDATFTFLRNGQPVGQMVRRWRGLVKDSFTDADAFHASLLHVRSPHEKALLFAAIFLIDYGCFEDKPVFGPQVGDLV